MIVRLEIQVRREAVGTTGLARLFSRERAKDYLMSYLVEGNCGFQEVHLEALYNRVSLRCLYVLF